MTPSSMAEMTGRSASNLTIKLGVTWSYYGQPANLFNQITTSTALRAIQLTDTSCESGSLPLGVRTFPTFPAPKNSFGPCVGFAYSPQWGGFLTGMERPRFRGGYRLLYDPPFYNIYLNMSSSAPEVFLQSFAGLQPATHPLPSVPTGTERSVAL